MINFPLHVKEEGTSPLEIQKRGPLHTLCRKNQSGKRVWRDTALIIRRKPREAGIRSERGKRPSVRYRRVTQDLDVDEYQNGLCYVEEDAKRLGTIMCPFDGIRVCTCDYTIDLLLLRSAKRIAHRQRHSRVELSFALISLRDCLSNYVHLSQPTDHWRPYHPSRHRRQMSVTSKIAFCVQKSV